MKSVSAGYATHIGKSTTTLALCLKATRTDGEVFGFTSFDRSLTVSAVVYVPGLRPSAVKATADMQPTNSETEGGFGSAAVTDEDIRAGRWDYAEIEVFRVNWADLTQGVEKITKGRLGQITRGRTQFTAEMLGMQTLLTKQIGRLVGAECPYELGDDDCTVDLAPFTITSTVSSSPGRDRFYDGSRTEVADYFTNGKVTITSGDNDGISREVKQYPGGSPTGLVILQLPFPFDIAPGTTYTMHAGCRFRFTEDCVAKFSNGDNFGGFPHVPGNRYLQSGKVGE